MVQFLYDQYIIIYAFAGLCGLGLLLRLIVNSVYKHLVKEADKLGETKNKMLKHMKMKFSTCYKLKIGVNNVDTFVDKSVSKYRFCGVLLSTWDNLCGQVLFLVLLLVPIVTVFGVALECGQDILLYTGAVGISASAVLILVDKSINLPGKKKLLRLYLLDYLENLLKVRLEQELTHPELVEQYRREYFQTVEGKKSSTAATLEVTKEDTKKELNRRKEARLKKEEEKRQLAEKREEEQRKAEEARKEEEKRKFEERRQLAAKRREEERQKLEEEREALEARRAELKRKAEEKQQNSERKHQKAEQNEEILQSLEGELKSTKAQVDMEALEKGVEEIVTKSEQEQKQEQKASVKAVKNPRTELQEEKLIEDVLKEFFA